MYKNDPRWIEARFRSKCSCGRQIEKGDRIFYYPRTKTAICEGCGKQGERDLMAEVSYDLTGTDCAFDY